MKRKDALWVMQMCRDRDARSEAEREAFDTAIEALKSESIFTADRPRGEQYKKGFEDAKRAFLVEYARESENMRKRIAQLEVRLNAQKAISADRPRGEWTLLAEERPVDGYEIIATVYWPGYGDSTIAVGHIDRFDNWHLYSPTEGELIKGFEVIAWKTLPEPYCGADMRSE